MAMNMKNLDRKLKLSFTLAKMDVDNFKSSMTDWIVFLDKNQREMKERIALLESKIRQIEIEKQIFA
jgi:hypothetical protein